MSKIAIDVVLLPPEDIMDKVIEINSRLIDDPIKLNKKNCLPHISLCMGVIEEGKLLEVNNILNKIGNNFSPLNLTINKINSRHIAFDLVKILELQRLHETIITSLKQYLSYDAITEMCYTPPPVVETAIRWINKYNDKSSFANYYPHITLGVTTLDEKEFKIDFTVDTIALCHLGNYCTCRKILHSLNLNNY